MQKKLNFHAPNKNNYFASYKCAWELKAESERPWQMLPVFRHVDQFPRVTSFSLHSRDSSQSRERLVDRAPRTLIAGADRNGHHLHSGRRMLMLLGNADCHLRSQRGLGAEGHD